MKFNLMQFLQILFGAAEQIVPVFIHNPQSQKIEGVIVGTLGGVLQGLSATLPAPAATGNMQAGTATQQAAPAGTTIKVGQ